MRIARACALTLAFLFAFTVCFAQTAAPAVPPATNVSAVELPEYFVAAGAALNQYSSSQRTAGWLVAGKLVSAKTYAYTAIDETSKESTMRLGVAYVLKQSGPFTLMALGDAGAAIGASTSAAFGTGASISLDLSKQLHVDGLYAVGAVRVLHTGGSGVVPVYEFGFGKSF